MIRRAVTRHVFPSCPAASFEQPVKTLLEEQSPLISAAFHCTAKPQALINLTDSLHTACYCSGTTPSTLASSLCVSLPPSVFLTHAPPKPVCPSPLLSFQRTLPSPFPPSHSICLPHSLHQSISHSFPMCISLSLFLPPPIKVSLDPSASLPHPFVAFLICPSHTPHLFISLLSCLSHSLSPSICLTHSFSPSVPIAQYVGLSNHPFLFSLVSLHASLSVCPSLSGYHALSSKICPSLMLFVCLAVSLPISQSVHPPRSLHSRLYRCHLCPQQLAYVNI